LNSIRRQPSLRVPSLICKRSINSTICIAPGDIVTAIKMAFAARNTNFNFGASSPEIES
jgi:hypothetical protein